MGKNVAVFVDVANIFYAAKAAGVDIDYVTLLKAATAGRDFVRAYAYTGLDPDNENQRNFHSFLSRHGYKVVSKDIRKYGDGKVKANLDIELVVDMMKTARNLDVAIVISGDGDFAPAIRAVQEMGVRVEVISFRGNTSSDLIEVADIFMDITQLAKVERGSSRSGRRVDEEEFDMAGTDIPDKQTEGTGARQRRGRGRGRGSFDDLPPRRESGGREPFGRDVAPREPFRDVRRELPRETPVAASGTPGPIVVLPGEKLSRVAASLPVQDEFDDVRADEELVEPETAVEGAAPLEGDDESGPRRRRRRGGRGRGRGRGRGEDGVESGVEIEVMAELPETEDVPAPVERAPRIERPERPARPSRPLEDEVPVAPRGPRPTPFGSVWDSQLGMPTASATPLGPLPDEEEEDEPEIPEYLLAERRRGAQGQGQGQGPRGRGMPGGGGRGMRPGYSAALDRERFGRGGLNRYGEPQGGQGMQGGGQGMQGGGQGMQGGGQGMQGGRPPQQSQGRPQGPRRDDRPAPVIRQDRPDRSDRPARSEEWSEVPPEIEEMLRAQMASRQRPQDAGRQRPQERQGGGQRRDAQPPERAERDERPERDNAETAMTAAADTVAPAAEEAAPARRRGRPPRDAAAATPATAATAETAGAATEADAETAAPAPARRGRPRRAATGEGAGGAAVTPPTEGPAEAATPATPASRATGTPARRGGRRPAADAAPEVAAAAPAPVPAAEPEAPSRPRRGRPPKSAAAAAPEAAAEAPAPDAATPARARRGRAAAATAAPAEEPATAAEPAATGDAAPARRRRATRSTAASE